MRGKITYYDTLGVARDASEDEIRLAFRRLTREHHPDRFSGDERMRAEERFQEITEAFNVLSRPESRSRYDEEISQGAHAKAMEPGEIARRLAAKGAQALRSGDLPKALELLRSAVDHDASSSRAHYFLGLTLARLKGREREGLRHLERAEQLEPLNATLKAEVAVVSLATGMSSRARRFAEQALELDPANAKATGVLEEIECDRKPSEGLLGRLRRKG